LKQGKNVGSPSVAHPFCSRKITGVRRKRQETVKNDKGTALQKAGLMDLFPENGSLFNLFPFKKRA
jgi:hypothetical protein